MLFGGRRDYIGCDGFASSVEASGGLVFEEKAMPRSIRLPVVCFALTVALGLTPVRPAAADDVIAFTKAQRF